MMMSLAKNKKDSWENGAYLQPELNDRSMTGLRRGAFALAPEQRCSRQSRHG